LTRAFAEFPNASAQPNVIGARVGVPGADIPLVRTCPKCQNWVPETVTSCPKCGSETVTPWRSGSLGQPPVAGASEGIAEPHAPASDTPWSPPEATSRKAPLWPFVASIAVLAVVVVSGVGAYRLTRGAGHPSHWDEQVAPIASRVEALRGLTFKHPVKVSYLSVQSFEKKMTTSPADLRKERAQIQQSTALLRAAGLVGADVDLAGAVNTTQAADTVAFYDTTNKQIYVRGTGPLTIETRVTLAHELTHVLQDQHFDLPRLEKRADASRSGSSDALRALIEGDAIRIEKRYLTEQSPAEQRVYAGLSAHDSAQATQRTQAVPAVVDSFFGAPYVFGPEVVRVLEATDGSSAIDAALTGPTPSTRIFLDPTVINDAPLLPPIPDLHPGEKAIRPTSGSDDQFDDFTLYLMLAARLDPPAALRAADAYSSGSEVLYTSSGRTCFRASIAGRSAGADAYLGATLRRWTATMPDARVDTTGATTLLESCDPGSRANTPNDENIHDAVALAAGRDTLTATLAAEHVSGAVAACAARVLVEQGDFRDALIHPSADVNATRREQLFRESVAAGAACRADSQAGLP